MLTDLGQIAIKDIWYGKFTRHLMNRNVNIF